MRVPERGEGRVAMAWLAGPLNAILLILGLFLIFLVLIQRGKGGGLVGALGGIGGFSPFGLRAGDTFTLFTIYVAVTSLFLTFLQVRFLQTTASQAHRLGSASGPQ